MSKIERRTLHGDRNQCPSCGEFFKSTHAFELHCVGRIPARHCLTVDEMKAKGMEKNTADFWTSRLMKPDERKRVIPEERA
jgi:hypothetical protein